MTEIPHPIPAFQKPTPTGGEHWAVAPLPSEERWVVARIFSKRTNRIRTEAEEMGCGSAMPVYKRVRYVAGQKSDVQRPLLPGYLFIRITPNDRARITELDGVYNLLAAGVRGSERLAEEKALMEMRAIEGAFNDVQSAPVERPAERVRRRRRRPRPGKRWRMKQREGIAA